MKISIITAVYNNVLEISSAMDSVLSQQAIDIEIIVVDGDSTDGTMDALRPYMSRIDTLVSARDNGIYPALNRGIALATGDYIGFLHSDDLFASPDAVANLFAGLEGDKPAAVWGDLNYVKKADPKQIVRRWISTPFSNRRLRWGWMPPHPALYVRRDAFEDVGGFDEQMRIAADYDFVLRLFMRGGDLRYVPGTVVSMRTGGASNRSLKAIWRKSREDVQALRRSELPVARALLGKNLGKIPQFLPWYRDR